MAVPPTGYIVRRTQSFSNRNLTSFALQFYRRRRYDFARRYMLLPVRYPFGAPECRNDAPGVDAFDQCKIVGHARMHVPTRKQRTAAVHQAPACRTDWKVSGEQD